MLRLVTIPKQVCLFCTIRIDSELFQKLNCATTGEKSGHRKIVGEEKEKWIEVLRKQLQNATIDDFNFKQLTNPEEWHRWVKSPRRSANAAFFTLLYRYNQIAKQKNKPTIDAEDIVQFIKDAADNPKSLEIEQLIKREDGYEHGNDKIVTAIIKAPIDDLLKGKDLGILGATTEKRLEEAGPETDMYIKLALEPTHSRDSLGGDFTVLQEGIQPISFHRDADSKNTKPDPEKPSVRDEAWDSGEIPEELLIQAPGRYFKEQEERRQQQAEKRK